VTLSRQQVLDTIIGFLERMAGDWDYSDRITEHTNLLGDMGLQSLDVVILANTIQEHYGRIFPFTEFLTAIGERGGSDVSVGEWADFIYEQLVAAPIEHAATGAQA
jgi:acyl carrier protein